MNQIPFTQEEQVQIEKSILQTTNINVKSALKRMRHNGTIKQMCYLLGCEIINLKSILDQVEEEDLTFGPVPSVLLNADFNTTQSNMTMNKSALVNHLSIYECTQYRDNQPKLQYINQLLKIRRKIEFCVIQALQKKIDSFLFSSSHFLRYSKDNMTMDRMQILSKLKKVEIMTLEDAKASSIAAEQEEDHLADLSNIYHDRGMVKNNTVSTHIDMEALEQDFKQCNKDLMYMIMKKCGKRSVSLFQTIYQSGLQENQDDKFVSVQQFERETKMINYLRQVNVIEEHPHNDRLVKMVNM